MDYPESSASPGPSLEPEAWPKLEPQSQANSRHPDIRSQPSDSEELSLSPSPPSVHVRPGMSYAAALTSPSPRVPSHPATSAEDTEEASAEVDVVYTEEVPLEDPTEDPTKQQPVDYQAALPSPVDVDTAAIYPPELAEELRIPTRPTPPSLGMNNPLAAYGPLNVPSLRNTPPGHGYRPNTILSTSPWGPAPSALPLLAQPGPPQRNYGRKQRKAAHPPARPPVAPGGYLAHPFQTVPDPQMGYGHRPPFGTAPSNYYFYRSGKKALNVDSPSFTPSTAKKSTFSTQAASAAPFTPRGADGKSRHTKS